MSMASHGGRKNKRSSRSPKRGIGYPCWSVGTPPSRAWRNRSRRCSRGGRGGRLGQGASASHEAKSGNPNKGIHSIQAALRIRPARWARCRAGQKARAARQKCSIKAKAQGGMGIMAGSGMGWLYPVAARASRCKCKKGLCLLACKIAETPMKPVAEPAGCFLTLGQVQVQGLRNASALRFGWRKRP
jgi:hypothetical protein